MPVRMVGVDTLDPKLPDVVIEATRADAAGTVTGTDNASFMTPIRVREMAPRFPVQDAAGDGVTDDHDAITDALTLAAAALRHDGAFYPDREPAVVLRPDRGYASTPLVVPQGVRMLCEGADLLPLSAGNFVTLDGSGACIEDAFIRGPGVGTAVTAGVHIPDGNYRCGVRNVVFDKLAGSAILINGGLAKVSDVFAQNCLLDTASLSTPTGVIHIEGTLANDGTISNTEVTSSRLALSAGGFAYGIVVLGDASTFHNVISEINDHGWYINGVFNKFTGCRADLNRGHGWVLAGGSGDLASCNSLSNGREATNTYDGYNISGGEYHFSACSADVLSTIASVQHRYGFNSTATTSTGPHFDPSCSSTQHATAAVAVADTGGRVVPTQGPFINTSGTGSTWSAQTYRWPHTCWNLAAGSARNLSTFTQGVPGQRLILRGDGNTTLVHNGSFVADTFRLTGGANLLTATHTFYEFIRASGCWIQL